MYVYRLSQALGAAGHSVTVVHAADAFRAAGRARGTAPIRSTRTCPVVPSRRRSWARSRRTATYLTGRPGSSMPGELSSVFDRRLSTSIHFHNVSLAGGPGVLGLGEAASSSTRRTSTGWSARCTSSGRTTGSRATEPECLRCSFPSTGRRSSGAPRACSSATASRRPLPRPEPVHDRDAPAARLRTADAPASALHPARRRAAAVERGENRTSWSSPGSSG